MDFLARSDAPVVLGGYQSLAAKSRGMLLQFVGQGLVGM
ncbi:hypothetical protein NB231_10633 [Nitrococcus mobilis Nb-231]|uniref:Uncharacterized protein n=1 Tax=Nitrococcus mobilis Nb-231 TaxID=314278 RepID=A4BNV4_9GAMM|nr:hypothetical protein NB231_10633 [Nitrococcus mobilis Nb-231]